MRHSGALRHSVTHRAGQGRAPAEPIEAELERGPEAPAFAGGEEVDDEAREHRLQQRGLQLDPVGRHAFARQPALDVEAPQTDLLGPDVTRQPARRRLQRRRLDAEADVRQAGRRGVHPAPPAPQQVGDAEFRIAGEPALEHDDLGLVRPLECGHHDLLLGPKWCTSALTLTPIALAIGRSDTSASPRSPRYATTASSSSTRRSTSGRRPITDAAVPAFTRASVRRSGRARRR